MRTVALVLSFTSFVFSQNQILVNNAASGLGGGIVPNSLAQVFLQAATAPDTPFDASTVTVQIQPAGGPPINAPVLSVPGIYSAIVLVPASVPLGAAQITLTFNGVPSAPASVNIVASNLGIYTQGKGFGPALVPPYDLTHPAMPAQTVTLWATGLGSASPKVFLGGHNAPVSYAGPAPGSPGLDQINFQIPNDPSIPDSCYVAVVVEAGGNQTSATSIPKNSVPGPCKHPYGLTADQLATLDGGGAISLPSFSIRSAIWPGFTRQEYMSANIGMAIASSIFAEPQVADDAYYSCAPILFLAPVFGLSLVSTKDQWDLGPQFVLSGPQSAITIPRSSPDISIPAFYTVDLSTTMNVPLSNLPAPFFVAGSWQIQDAGGMLVPPFQATFQVPPPLAITNADALSTVNRSNDLAVTWDGSGYSAAHVASVSVFHTGAPYTEPSVFCRVPAQAGKIVIPSIALRNLAAGPAAQVQVTIGYRPDSIPGISIPKTAGGPVPARIDYQTIETIASQIK
jgi:uncharacterized protein (TIGR03437 family)